MRNLLILGILAVIQTRAETGRDAWLRYAPVKPRFVAPAVIVTAHDSVAQQELLRGMRGMLGKILRVEPKLPPESALIVGTLAEVRLLAPDLLLPTSMKPDAYLLRTFTQAGARRTVITGGSDRAVLYGVFGLLRKIAAGEDVSILNDLQTPGAAIRWINQWDNLDGSIERGYGGRSIFWDRGHVREDLTRVSEYGRLLASVGINATTIDNVNADKRLLSAEFIPQIARIAEVLRPWGVRVAVSVDFGSPQSLGGLDTFDPLDPRVAAWWKARADELYSAVPDLAGFVLKADSEGRVGPSAYQRTHADAANVVARALQGHGGLLLYRGFVYDHHMDWNNPKNDRARAAYDNFQPLDGQFDDNVVIQIKNGPIDFQVREPASPLFDALKKTHEAVELQITQEYMGQARHMVYLVPQWKEALRAVSTPINGFVGVANVGLDDDWTGNHLSQANLYGFGRLAWDAGLSSERIIDEWTRLTFGNDPQVLTTVSSMQLRSWRAYENYTGPLGLQTLTDIVGDHYGVAVEASEANGWGQWHRADAHGVGMDRTAATGTGYIGQYRPALARLYEDVQRCPDDLLLFMHHVPYTHVLHSGKTVIQSIYDMHSEGASTAANFAAEWKTLKGRMDDQRFAAVLTQLEYQAGQAELWRDAVSGWFLRISGIPDATGRAGHHPNRMEAESMQLEGYKRIDVKPWEAASGGSAVTCELEVCRASFGFNRAAGWYSLRIRYFDQPGGVAHFRVTVGNQSAEEWAANDTNPARRMDAPSSTLHVTAALPLRPGDRITVEGRPDMKDPAALDYVELVRLPD